MKRVIFSIDFLSHNHTFWLPHIQAHANMSSRRVTENPWSMIGWIPWISYRHDITHFCNRYNYNCQKSISMFISKVWIVSFYEFAECSIFKGCINLIRNILIETILASNDWTYYINSLWNHSHWISCDSLLYTGLIHTGKRKHLCMHNPLFRLTHIVNYVHSCKIF